jgi:hypothetical protein
MSGRALALAALLVALPAAAQEEREEALFGAPTAPAAVEAPKAPTAPEVPLAVGGLAYLRGATTWNRSVPPSRWALQAPLLADLYADARPNDRVRAFGLARLTYDPTIPSDAANLFGARVAQTREQLDQLWLNFDVARTVYVTVGKQHVKWGTGHFWNPTDWLHPVRRDPLAQLDVRTGITMVKAHLPWEARGWNLYGVLVAEDLAGRPAAPYATFTAPDAGASNALGHVGGGGRAELVLGPVELGLDAVAQRGHKPKLGADLSFPLGDFDLLGEFALRTGRDAPRWTLPAGADRSQLTSWVASDWDRLTPAALVGVEWSWKYSDEDLLRAGAEFFWDDAGYSDPHVYPVLLASPYNPANGGDTRVAFTPFYVGRRYAALFVNVPKPGRWNDTTFTVTVVANLDDGSAIARLDHSVVVNTYLTVESYLAGHLGKEGGEFRFGATLPPQAIFGGASITLPTPVLDMGVALRVKL